MAIAVDHAAFHAALRDVRNAATELEHVRDQAAHQVDAFVEGGWSGLAAEAFARSWDDWRRAADDVLNALVSIGNLLDYTHQELTASDLGSRDALDRVGERLQARLG
jgi:WXG100 family type VII secretion target